MMTELHPKLREILATAPNPDAVPVEAQDPDEARAEWKADMRELDAPAPEMAVLRDVQLTTDKGVLAARVYVPDDLLGDALPCLVYFHGGGFIRGDIETHDSICRVLAKNAAVMVISIAYRLAPEHRFPAALDDAYAALEAIVKHVGDFGIDPTRIAVGGDSAGGNLAAAVCLAARDRGGPSIKAQLLIYPVTDLVGEPDSKRLYSNGFLLDSMPFYISSYLGPDGDGHDPLASPLRAETLANLPDAVVLTAGFDPLRDEGDTYAARLTDAGNRVTHLTYPDMIHGFVSLRGLLPEADQALVRMATELGGLLGQAPERTPLR
ncbi:alpha/beta hydrolase [Oceaniradius stylonematis]|jgi:acetyl esterase|uniref:Alpha/beta hydrolase n=2 Tax=Oceaniradius stylonematis TaxID=2184161 RepID=A0A3A8A9F0_9HYPH|nr:alpha/beta hydrolase [Oceaniradius stylonematis]